MRNQVTRMCGNPEILKVNQDWKAGSWGHSGQSWSTKMLNKILDWDKKSPLVSRWFMGLLHFALILDSRSYLLDFRFLDSRFSWVALGGWEGDLWDSRLSPGTTQLLPGSPTAPRRSLSLHLLKNGWRYILDFWSHSHQPSLLLKRSLNPQLPNLRSRKRFWHLHF